MLMNVPSTTRPSDLEFDPKQADLPTTHPMWPEQVALEMEMLDRGVERYRAIVRKARDKKQESSTPHVRRILKHLIDPTAEAIRDFEAACKRKRGVKPVALDYFKQVGDAEVIAYITLRNVLDGASMGFDKAISMSISIAQDLQQECRMRLWAEKNPGIWEAYQTRLRSDGATQQHRQIVLRHGFNKLIREKEGWEDWPKADLVHIGWKCLEMLCKGTGRFTMKEIRTARQMSHTVIEANPETAEWVTRTMHRQELMQPAFLPMVVPPRRVTMANQTPYWTDIPTRSLGDMALVKFEKGFTAGMRKEAMKELRQSDMEYPLEAIHALQQTGWSVNKRVLEVVQQLWKVGNPVGILPPAGDLPLPPKPADIETNAEARRQWRIKASAVYRQNRGLLSKRLSTIAALEMAEKFSKYPAFYYPHSMDFRGRYYAVSNHLKPDGDDLAKGLLQFSEGRPIDSAEAAEWLAIHVANCWGVDKVSYEERIRWTWENTPQIIEWAKAPLADLGWAQADKGEAAFQFLAACIEWAGFQKVGYGYVSRLPIRVDGTCNGLQHLSAMLLDEEGGRATNLVPGDKPADIYMEVAGVVTRRLQQIASGSDERADLARRWLGVTGGSVPRALAKRPIMIVPYGGTVLGVRGYIEEWLEGVGEEGLRWFPNDDGQRADGDGKPHIQSTWSKGLTLMTDLVWKAIQEKVVAAGEVFRWIKQCTRVACRTGKPIRWTTPSGFTVFQWYAEHEKRTVRVQSEGREVQLKVPHPTNEMDTSGQLSGVAPNFVHSMDAAALTLTVVSMWRMGVKSLTTIHDSYGTHAADMGLLSETVRKAFVEMYSGDCVLESFRQDLQTLVPDEELPPVPDKGKLVLEGINHSPYFFA